MRDLGRGVKASSSSAPHRMVWSLLHHATIRLSEPPRTYSGDGLTAENRVDAVGYTF